MKSIGRSPSRATGPLLAAAALLAFTDPGVAAEIKIGGYTNLEIIWADKLTGNGDTNSIAPGLTAIPLDDDAKADNNSFVLDARQTRLNFTGTGEVEGAKLRGFVEIDFFTNEGNRFVTTSRGPRLRHAFAQATLPSGLFIVAGQTWSPFVNLATGAPARIDFSTPPGALTGRQAQLSVGYTASGLTAIAGIESHSVNVAGATSADIFAENQELPLVSGRLTWTSSFLTAEASAAVARNRAVFTTDEDSATAWGVEGGVKVPIGPLSIVGHVQLLEGLNRFNSSHFKDAVVNTGAGTIDNIRTLGWYVGASYALRPTTTLNAVYNMNQADEESYYTGDNDEEFTSIHANILQKFWGNMQVGLEFERKTREQFSGREGDVNRVHAAWWYFF